MLITFEGIDGCGKSTLVKALADKFNKHTQKVHVTKEPGSPHIKSNLAIREMVLQDQALHPISRELLFYADAHEHRRFVESAYGYLPFLSDRGLWSHLAYLYAYLKTRKIDYEDYWLCKKIITRVCAKPDLVVYLDGDLDLMAQRSMGKEKDAIESLGQEFYAFVLAQYDDLCEDRKLKQLPLLKLDARRPFDENLDICYAYLREVVDEQIS